MEVGAPGDEASTIPSVIRMHPSGYAEYANYHQVSLLRGFYTFATHTDRIWMRMDSIDNQLVERS